MKRGNTTTLTFRLDKETKGAVRYCEVDEQGNPVQIIDGTIGAIYIRKDKLEGNKIPGRLTVQISIP